MGKGASGFPRHLLSDVSFPAISPLAAPSGPVYIVPRAWQRLSKYLLKELSGTFDFQKHLWIDVFPPQWVLCCPPSLTEVRAVWPSEHTMERQRVLAQSGSVMASPPPESVQAALVVTCTQSHLGCISRPRWKQSLTKLRAGEHRRGTVGPSLLCRKTKREKRTDPSGNGCKGSPRCPDQVCVGGFPNQATSAEQQARLHCHSTSECARLVGCFRH